MRVKTVWFGKGAARAPEEIASVLAATLWRLADELVDGLSRAGYDIATPTRALGIVAEVLAYGLHLCDRRAYGRCSESERAALVLATGTRLAQIMEENVRALDGGDGRDTHARFVALLNRRGDEYAGFELPESGNAFAPLRHLAAQIREIMERADQPWIMDQVMEVEMPRLLGSLDQALDGLLGPRARPE